MTDEPRSSNLILSALPAADYDLLRPHLSYTELLRAAVLAEAGREVGRVYFPHDGIISLVVRLTQGETIECAMVGRDGVFGAAAALDGRISLTTAIVQMPGRASIIGVVNLRSAAERSAPLRSLIMRHEQVVLAQALQSAACYAVHPLQNRLSRWLLRARDLIGRDKMFFTQEFLAQMLGCNRNAVTIVAKTLQEEGLISLSSRSN